jgi:predicted ABC-type ATPase
VPGHHGPAAKLLGLDAPIRVRQEIITADDIDQAIREMNEEADALEAAQLAIDSGIQPHLKSGA